MKKAKTIGSVILAAALCISVFAGCGTKVTPPEDVVKSYFSAVKNYDQSKITAFSSSSSASLTASSSSNSAEGNDITKLIFKKMDGTVEGKAQISGDNATVKVKISAPDMKQIIGDAYKTALKDALNSAFSASSLSSSEISSKFNNDVKDELSKSNVTLKATEMNVQLVKKGDKWLVKSTSELADAMSGGMVDASKQLSATESSSSN